MEKKACAAYHSGIDALKSSVNNKWANLDVNVLKSVYSRFRSRLQHCIADEGGIFDKK